MKTAPIFEVLSESQAVNDKLCGTDNILRVYEFGDAPQNVIKPYLVWQLISGSPFQNLSCRPRAEEHYIQVDVYSHNQQEVKEIQQLIEYELETHAEITSYRGDSFEEKTKLWRSSFDLKWFLKR